MDPMEPTETMEVSSNKEEASLMHTSDKQEFGEEQAPQRVGSQTSLSSFIQVKKSKLASVPEVMMNTFKAFIGSGLLGLPYGYLKAGWVPSLIAFPLFTALCCYTLLDLVDCKVYLLFKLFSFTFF